MSRSLAPLALLAACTAEPPDAPPGAADGYVLGSVVITPDGRTTYFQVLEDLDPEGPVTNEGAVEAGGNGVLMVHGRDVFLGLAESPEWVRYTVAEDGTLSETGRMSLANAGFSYVDYGNTIVADDLAVSVSTESLVAVIWDPSTMTITQTVDLPHLARDGYSVEVWTTVAHDGLVYVPSRWADWEGGRIYPAVQTTILDPRSGDIIAIAEDDRCPSGGRIEFDEDGTAYVMADGRSYSAQMFANAGGQARPTNCILRMLPGETDYDPDYLVEVPSLTGGPESVTELIAPVPGEAFVWMFHEDQLPADVEPVDFGFWSYPAFKMWHVSLGQTPTAEPVDGLPFGVLGFTDVPLDGKLYTGVGDTEQTAVFEVDPATGAATERFTMDGYLYGLHRLE